MVASNVVKFRDPYALARKRAKRQRYVDRLGRPAINKRREKRRRRTAREAAQAKHCLTCGCTHSGWCPPEAFVVVTCTACGNQFIQPADVGPMIGFANCGKCERSDAWETRPATRTDMYKHWRGYGDGTGKPLTLKKG